MLLWGNQRIRLNLQLVDHHHLLPPRINYSCSQRALRGALSDDLLYWQAGQSQLVSTFRDQSEAVQKQLVPDTTGGPKIS